MKTMLAFLLLFGLGAWTRTEPFDPFHAASIAPPSSAHAPLDGALRDQRGRTVTLGGLSHGRPIVLVPVQYKCPSLCGLTLSGAGEAAAHMPNPDFALVVLGIDPREGPPDAAALTKRLNLPPAVPLYALTGPSRAITDALGYRFAWDQTLKQYAHISAVAVLRPDGRLVRWLAGPQVDPRELGAALREARGGPPMALSQRLLLLCYHLTSSGGAYDQRVIQILRFAGGMTMLLLLLLIGWTASRDRRRTGS